MVNKNYQTGRRFEHKIVKILKENLAENKYTIIRTAGSHSPVDVFVVEHRGNRAFGIQCKSKKGKKPNKEESIFEKWIFEKW